MEAIDINKTAKQIVDAIKNELNKKRTLCYEDYYEVEIHFYRTTSYSMSYTIGLGVGKIMINHLSTEQARNLVAGVIAQLVNLSRTKGWSNLTWEYKEYDFGRGYYSNRQNIPSVVRLMANPCKEFKSLANYMEKYCGTKLAIDDIYSVAIGGKRGRVNGESSRRHYLAHKPKKCSELLNELRKARGSKDIVTTSDFMQIDDIEDWLLDISIYRESEFEGIRHNQCEVTIKSPTGKVKKVIQIKAN